MLDNAIAHDLIDEIRWRFQRYCPRCKSVYIKRVNSSAFRELHRCVDCGYMYNSLAGTIFQGTRLPVPKFFHLFTMYNAIGDILSIKDICYVLDISYKTGATLLTKLQESKIEIRFALIDKDLSDTFRSKFEGQTATNEETFFSYCEMKHIVVNEHLFIEYLYRLMEFGEVARFV